MCFECLSHGVAARPWPLAPDPRLLGLTIFGEQGWLVTREHMKGQQLDFQSHSGLDGSATGGPHWSYAVGNPPPAPVGEPPERSLHPITPRTAQPGEGPAGHQLRPLPDPG